MNVFWLLNFFWGKRKNFFFNFSLVGQPQGTLERQLIYTHVLIVQGLRDKSQKDNISIFIVILLFLLLLLL